MITEQNQRGEIARILAGLMMTAARTAPKGRGRDTLYIAMAGDSEIIVIAEKMKELAISLDMKFFARDAENLLKSDALVLLGTGIGSLGLKSCSYCGYSDCAEKNQFPKVPCAFNLTDLGIALGSAAAVAAAHHADNRIMFSIGKAVLELGWVPEEISVMYGIPISVGPKNIFFDR